MFDLTSLIGAAAGLKTAGEMVASIANAKSQADVTAKAIELQSVIIGLQSTIFDARDALAGLQEENRKLKEQAVSREDFTRDMARYTLASIRPGSVAYALTESMSQGEPPHYVCANCYQGGKKSCLSCVAESPGWFGFKCPSCKHSISTGYRNASAAKYAEQIA